MPKASHLLVVGKFKNAGLEAVEKDFLKRLKHFPLIIHEIKASAENPKLEYQEIQKKLQALAKERPITLVALWEKGDTPTSRELAEWLQKEVEQAPTLVFLIGGAQGLEPTLLQSAQKTLSLSQMTLPHRLARILFVEQFYRAQGLVLGHPYHND